MSTILTSHSASEVTLSENNPLKLTCSQGVGVGPAWLQSPLVKLVSPIEAEAIVCLPQEVGRVRQVNSALMLIALQDDAEELGHWGEGAIADEIMWIHPTDRELKNGLLRVKRQALKYKYHQLTERKIVALELASQSLSSAHDEETIYQTLVDIVADQLMSERVSLLSVEREHDCLKMRAAHGISSHIVAQARPKIGEGIAGLCAQRGEPIFISDHHRFKSGDEGEDEGEPLPMSLTVPILTRGEVVGVVNVTGRAEETPYTHHDIAFLSALMSHAGYLMESATLVSGLKGLQAFSDKVLNTLNDPLVVLDQKGRLLKENQCFINLYKNHIEDEEIVQILEREGGSALGSLEFIPTPMSVFEADLSPLLRWVCDNDLELRESLSRALIQRTSIQHNGWRKGDEVFDLRLIPFEEPQDEEEFTQSPRAILYFQNVTQRQQMQRQLVSAEKMASLGILSAGVAHEINNPLGFVKTNTKEAGRYLDDLLEIIDAWHQFAQEKGFGEDVAPYRVERDIELDELRSDAPNLVRESLDGLDRMQKIIASLKSFAHPDTESTREVQLSTLVEHALVITQGKWRHHLTISKDLPQHPALSCIPNQLEQVFMNLVVNAAQATQDKGKSATMHISLSEPAEGWIELRFADTCGGIPLDLVERIFDPFFTTKDIGEGTGLGLHIAHNIIEGHGGEIRVESNPPQGTTFVLTLPLGKSSGPLVIKQLSRFKV